ncbi:nucleotidyltransferase family protein [Emcibacter sp.]|uniref:nucleotidyltransferase family protein n=1 Tax=Emcibacter sp. TaxID=1979954 RepID=UPI003A92CB1A
MAAIVLAAGQSRRMGEQNKLLLPFGNSAILGTVLDNLLAVGLGEIYLVTGHEAEKVQEAVAGQNIRIIHNPDYALGLSSSLKAGIAALSEATEAAMICLGDMPGVTAEDYRKLVEAWAPGKIIVPVQDGRQGNPVIFDRKYFSEIMEFQGDRGAKTLLVKYRDQLVTVPCGHEGIFRDVDTPEDYHST